MEQDKTPFRVLNINALIEDYRQEKITERLRFKYLMAELLLVMLGASLSIQTPPEAAIPWLINTTILLAAVATGTWYCYLQNAQGDNVDFVSRYISVNFVVSMRFAIAYVGIVIALIITFPFFENSQLLSESGPGLLVNVSIITITLILYYYLCARYVGQIAK